MFIKTKIGLDEFKENMRKFKERNYSDIQLEMLFKYESKNNDDFYTYETITKYAFPCDIDYAVSKWRDLWREAPSLEDEEEIKYYIDEFLDGKHSLNHNNKEFIIFGEKLSDFVIDFKGVIA